jgi:hypothetical protein
MADRPIPLINYNFVPSDGHNIYREKFAALTDDEWCELLCRSVGETTIDGVQFPGFPEVEFQNRVHGNSGTTAVAESGKFFKFVKQHTYATSANASTKKLLDFGSGWGRVVRPFMRDFEFRNLYGFEPDFLFCALARTLNPFVAFLAGDFLPAGQLPGRYFDLMVGWSIFSHLSLMSATQWLKEAARVVTPGGFCVFTTWGDRFLKRLQKEADDRKAGREIHWYSSVCIAAAGSIEEKLASYEKGDFVWFTSGKSTLYGEAFVSENAIKNIISANSLPFAVVVFDKVTLGQDVFVLKRLP